MMNDYAKLSVLQGAGGGEDHEMEGTEGLFLSPGMGTKGLKGVFWGN